MIIQMAGYVLTDSYLTEGETVFVSLADDKVYKEMDLCPACPGLGEVEACICVGILAAEIYDSLTKPERAMVDAFSGGRPMDDIAAMFKRAGLPVHKAYR